MDAFLKMRVSSPDINTSMIEPIKKRNTFFGILIIVAIVLPMILAYFIFKTGIGFPSGTTNKGILLSPPQAIGDLVLSEGQKDMLSNLYQAGSKKRWRILVPVTRQCDASCQSHLYITRQVHIRLAEKAYRVERVLLLLDPMNKEELAKLEQDHPTTLMLQSTQEALRSWLSEAKLPHAADHYYYLIDQNGFAMMRYDNGHSGQDLLDDVKKLLKFTYDK